MTLTRRDLLKAAGALGLLGPLGCAGSLPGLLQRQESPYNAEPALDQLPQSWLTPLRSFYVRSHGPVPSIDPAAWRLSIGGLVERPQLLSLDELRRAESGTVAATLQCAGNRRGEISRIKTVGGVQWDAGAIGNAEWRGASLAALLKRAGVKAGAKYVWFEGLDQPTVKEQKLRFGAMIPLEKAMRAESLVAIEMNGAPLTPSHGAPARALIPGYIGARSVKWVGAITVADVPFDNYFSAKDYKYFAPDVTAETAKWDEKEPIYEYLLSSAICSPMANETVKAGRVALRGYALAPGGGATLTRLEVSADGGKSWTEGRLTGTESAYAWRLWEAEVDLAPGNRVLSVRAADSTGRVQPEQPAWNFKGYLCNSWHRVPVTVI